MSDRDELKGKVARSMCEWKNEPCPGGCICEFRANAALTAIEDAGYVIVPKEYPPIEALKAAFGGGMELAEAERRYRALLSAFSSKENANG